MSNEIWMPITGYEGLYEISSHGRVKSLKRVNVYGDKSRVLKEKIKKECYNSEGYPIIGLHKDNIALTKSIHRIVGMHFIPNPNNYNEINHIDGNKKNNTSSNLEWVSREQNMQHSYANGLSKSGEQHFKVKLTVKKVLAIRRLLKINPKCNRPLLANKLKISRGALYAVEKNISWKNI